MIGITARILTLGTLLFLYVTLEVSLFRALGWQGGLLASMYFTAFSVASLAGFLYRSPRR